MRMEREELDMLERNLESLVGDLAAMKVLNESALDRVCESLQFLADAWRGKEMVPRSAVAMLLDLDGLMLNVSKRYGPDVGPKIVDKAAILQELIGNCFVDARKS